MQRINEKPVLDQIKLRASSNVQKSEIERMSREDVGE
jgi:hypothetical protein